MKPLKAKVSITIDHNIVGELKDLADEDDRSLSQYINMILKAYLNKLHQSSGQSSKILRMLEFKAAKCYNQNNLKRFQLRVSNKEDMINENSYYH